MNESRSLFGWRLLIAIGVLSSWRVSSLWADEPLAKDDPAERLLGLWQNQRDAIQTARIHYRLYVRAMPNTAPGPSVSVMNALIDQWIVPDQPDQLRDFDRALTPETTLRDPAELPWSECQFLTDSVRYRNEGNHQIAVTDEVYDLRRRDLPPAQIEVHWAHGSRIQQSVLRDFRWLPSESLRAARLNVSSQGTEEWTALLLPRVAPSARQPSVAAGIEIRVDSNSGIIRQATRWDQETHERTTEWRGLGFADFHHDPRGATPREGNLAITLPRVSILCDYQAGQLASIAIRWIERCELNRPVAKGEFRLPATAGDRLVDDRFDLQTTTEIAGSLPDIRSVLTPPPLTASAPPLIRQIPRRKLALVVVGIVLVGTGAWLWNRTKTRSVGVVERRK